MEERQTEVIIIGEKAKSFLPSWVLRMREKIETSRTAHEVLEIRLASLSFNTKALNDKIFELNPKLDDHGESISSHHKHYQIPEKKYSTKHLYELYQLPIDILGVIFQFIEVRDIFNLEIVCASFKSIILLSEMWKLLYHTYFPYRCNIVDTINNNNSEYRNEIISHGKRCKQCIAFIKMMKNQRCVPKHRSIQPHRHSKSERHITHPLPVFDNLSNTESALIMSRSETFNSDFRHIANTSLEIMYELTINYFDPIHDRLAIEGAVSVLVSLLSNEAGALQSYSCGILANLLCWESRKRIITYRDLMSQIKTYSKYNNWDDFHTFIISLNKSDISHKSITKQIESCCNVPRLLLTLLSSPTASINLAGSTARITGGFRESRMTASVQGVATRQACRALANLFHPSAPIPAPAPDRVSSVHTAPFMSHLFLHEDFPRPWKFSYFHKSGALKDRFNAYLKFSPDGHMRGRGVDNIGIFYIVGKVDIDISGYVWYFHKTYVSQVEIENGGFDVKSWIELAADEYDTSGLRTKSHVSHLGYWSEGLDEKQSPIPPSLSPSRKSNQKSSLSLSGHLLSLPPKVLDYVHEFMNLHECNYLVDEDSRDCEENIEGVWGLGLYGVWETSSQNSHFDLQKGGIYRCVPIMIL